MGTKCCSRCKKLLPLTEFGICSGKIHAYCKECQRAYQREYYFEHRSYYSKSSAEAHRRYTAFVDSLKEKPCLDCGETYPVWVMCFDHVRGTRLLDFRTIRRRVIAKERVLAEYAKCDVVCSNCLSDRMYHRRTYGKEKRETCGDCGKSYSWWMIQRSRFGGNDSWLCANCRADTTHKLMKENKHLETKATYVIGCSAGDKKRQRTKRKWWKHDGINITQEQYDLRYEQQNGKCAICGKSSGFRSLAVDHNHATGTVRGLLCVNCNTGIGQFGEDLAVLKRVTMYLKHSGSH